MLQLSFASDVTQNDVEKKTMCINHNNMQPLAKIL